MRAFPADDPAVVWHYTDAAGLLSILRTHTLWATSSPFLNDAGEVELGLDLITRRLSAHVQDIAEAAHLVEKLERSRQSLGSAGSGAFFILSASQHWDSLAMWRCYGGAGESYAIGLDAAAPLLVLGDPEGYPEVDGAPDDGFVIRRRPWAPVVYDPREQCRMVDTALSRVPEVMSTFATLKASKQSAHTAQTGPGHGDLSTLDSPAVTELIDQLEMTLLLTKHQGFLDERETRLATVLYANPEDPGMTARLRTFVRYRPTRYGIAPYLWLTGSAPDTRAGAVGTITPHPLPIRGVAISPSANGHAAEQSLLSMLAAQGYSDVPVQRSSIPFRD